MTITWWTDTLKPKWHRLSPLENRQKETMRWEVINIETKWTRITSESYIYHGRIILARQIKDYLDYWSRMPEGKVFFLRHCFTMCPIYKIRAAWPYMLSVSLVRCKNEALNKLYFKSIIKCFTSDQIYHIHFPPCIDNCV